MSSDRVRGVGLLVRGVSLYNPDWLRLGGADCYRTAEDDDGTLGLSANSGTCTEAPTKGVLGFNTLVGCLQEKSNLLRSRFPILIVHGYHGVIWRDWQLGADPTPNQKSCYSTTFRSKHDLVTNKQWMRHGKTAFGFYLEVKLRVKVKDRMDGDWWVPISYWFDWSISIIIGIRIDNAS